MEAGLQINTLKYTNSFWQRFYNLNHINREWNLIAFFGRVECDGMNFAKTCPNSKPALKVPNKLFAYLQ